MQGQSMFKRFSIGATLIGAVIVFAGFIAGATTRQLSESEPMPDFTVQDVKGHELSKPKEGTVELLAFLSLGKKPSIQALADLDEIVSNLGKASDRLVYVVVSDDPNLASALQDPGGVSRIRHLVVDSQYKLWGRYGVIASPTVFVADPQGKIALIKAGYGYDFAPVVQAKLRAVLGLEAETLAADAGQVKTLDNNKPASKAAQHLQMAKLLEQKRKYDSALEQLGMAQKLDPDSVEIALEIGRLYCRASKPEKAIETVKPLVVTGNEKAALRSFVLGKSYRMTKDWAQAEKNLLDALKYNPKDSEALYELGRVYHLQDQKDKALELYSKSLELIYGNGQ
jgi:tetratricopeptide (TPR) repeat protein